MSDGWLTAGETPGAQPRPTAAADLPADAFPLRIICIAPDDRTVVFHEVVAEAPAVLTIPGLGPGAVGRCVVLYADGTWEETTT